MQFSIPLVFSLSALVVFVVLVLGYVGAQDPRSFPMQLSDISTITLKTGDVIFTRGRTIRSKLQQFLFGSYINHCAMVFVDREGRQWIWDTSASCGAYMSPLHHWLSANWKGRQAIPHSPPIGLNIPYISPHDEPFYEFKSQLFLRRLVGDLDEDAVLSFIQENIGKPYSLRLWKRAWERAGNELLTLPIPEHLLLPGKGFFCSELVARTLEAGGALLSSEAPLPDDIWRGNLLWRNSFRFSETERLTAKAWVLPETENWRELANKQDTASWIRGALAAGKTSSEKRLVQALALRWHT